MSHATLSPAPAGYTLLEELGPRLAKVRTPGGETGFLKRLTPRMRVEPLARAQLATEIAALQLLPGGVGAPYLAHGEDDAGPWLVEAFLEGRDLEALVTSDGLLSERRARALYESASSRLVALHGAADAAGSLQLVHGDLSPSNLFVLRSGEVRLVDFELGSLRGRPPPHDGSFRGTLQYASPAVARGGVPGPGDDRFAVAVCCLFALAGVGPRPEHGPALLAACGDGPPQVPALADRELEDALRLALGAPPR